MKIIIVGLIFLSWVPCFAATVQLINPNFSIDGDRIVYKGPNSALGRRTIDANSETYSSQITNPGSNGFFYVHLDKKNGKPIRSYEFTEGESGLRAGTVKYNQNGQPMAFTGCTIWSGCVTITKRFCNSILINGYTSKQIKSCGDALDTLLFTANFKSPTYQKLAESEYEHLSSYRSKHKLMRSNENEWGTWLERSLARDKGQWHVTDLKENMSKLLGEHQWDYSNAIKGLGRAFELCEDHGQNLVLGPRENVPGSQAVYPLKSPIQK